MIKQALVSKEILNTDPSLLSSGLTLTGLTELVAAELPCKLSSCWNIVNANKIVNSK